MRVTGSLDAVWSVNFLLPYAGGEEPGSADYQKYGLQDFARMEAYERGDWSFLYIHARAIVRLKAGNTIVVRSLGLGGVESDDDWACYRDEELADLKGALRELGFSDKEIDAIEVTERS
jgi:hypothetical protein